MTYTPATQDQLLAIRVNAGIEELAQSERFAAAEPDMVEAIVSGIGEFAAGEWAPLNRVGDLEGARLGDSQGSRRSDGGDFWHFGRGRASGCWCSKGRCCRCCTLIGTCCCALSCASAGEKTLNALLIVESNPG